MAVQYKRNNRKFINPYTFVPTPKNQHVSRGMSGYASDDSLHTGVLRCRLYVRTPLGIPDAEKEQEKNGHKTYPFFSYWEEGKKVPVIPGSSLRGTVRSVFETATDSCFSTLRKDTGLSKRAGTNEAYKPGILKWAGGEWKLYQAERYLLAVDPCPIGDIRGAVDRNYNKYRGLPGEAYVNILQRGKEGPRFARLPGDGGSGPAKYLGKDKNELYFGDEVEFRVASMGKSSANSRFSIWEGAAIDIRKLTEGEKADVSKKRGIVYIGETFAKKKRGESIFVAGREVPDFGKERLKKAYKGLLETLEIYRNPAINRSSGHSGYKGFEHADRERGIPVWYSVRDAKLSLASIGRTLYNTTLNDLAGEREPCNNRKRLCEACKLFGMTGEENLGSRIRFTDARAKEGYTLQSETLQILGQPRYSYLPFYAREKGRAAYSYDDPGVEIAGRKFYWHNEKAATDPTVYKSILRNRMNNTLELVMPGAEFTFEVYYDGITEEQLEKLMWCLNFGENREDGAMCHKIGHGKPLGLGSAKLVIEEKAERIFENGYYEWRHEKPAESVEAPKIRNREALERVMNFHWLRGGMNQGVAIMYPDVYDEDGKGFPEERDNKGARHIWYMKNKEKPGPRNNNDRVETLPDIFAKDQALHGYQMQPGSGNNSFKGNFGNGSKNRKDYRHYDQKGGRRH